MTEQPEQETKTADNQENTVREMSEEEHEQIEQKFFCKIFVKALKAPNIFLMLKEKQPYMTLEMLDEENAEVQLAASEVYTNIMPMLKPMIGQFDYLYKYYERYKGIANLTFIIAIGISTENKQRKKAKDDEKDDQRRGSDSDIRAEELRQDNEDVKPPETA